MPNAAPVIGLGTGIATSDLAQSDFGQSVVIQPDGKIVVVGHGAAASSDFVVVRYNADGSLDTSFDGDGTLTTDFGTGTSLAFDVALQTDGKIVVVGYVQNGLNGLDVAVARYNTDGTLDTTFSGDGKALIPIGSGSSSDTGASVTVLSDGKILVAGSAGNDFALLRFNVDGTLDTTFDGDGKVTTSISLSDRGESVVVQADGKIIVAGYTGTTHDFALVRYNTDGSLDTTFDVFDADGIVTTDFGVAGDTAYSVALQPDGKIVVAGRAWFGTTPDYDFALVRYNTDGSLDTTFSEDGIVTTPVGASHDQGQSVAIQSDGKIVVAGFYAGVFGDDFAVVRYDTDGTLDESFGGDGIVVTQVTLNVDRAYSVAIQSDGKIVVAGYSDDGTGNDITAVRYNSDGSLDTSFGPRPPVDFTEGGAAVALAPLADLSDADNADLTGATVSITGGFQAGDVLGFTDQNGITGSYDAVTGVLSLTGTATVAQYQAALRSITFSSTSDNPDNFGNDTIRIVSWEATDGTDTSNVATSTVAITPVNDAPTGVAIVPVAPDIAEDTSTAARVKVADIAVTDVDDGANDLTVIGADAASFEIDGTELFLKMGVVLDFETKTSFSVAVEVDDTSVGSTPDATSATFVLNVTDVSPEIINGTSGDDADLTGGIDVDQIFGFAGMDTLTGGLSQDLLTGGLDADTFVFTDKKDSKKGANNRDTIADFEQGEDTIDLSQIDAKKGGDDNAFKWKGTKKLKKKGDLHYKDKGDYFLVEGDVKGNGKPDFQIKVEGTGLAQLLEDDFIL